MLAPRSFQRRIFLALMAVAVIPVGLLIWGGVSGLDWVGSIVGTAGPWTGVAESGQVLLESIEDAASQDTTVAVAAREHQETLTNSVRISRVYAVLIDRARQLLPLGAIFLALLVVALAFFVTRRLSRGFSRPIQDLVLWTGRIAHHESLPEPTAAENREVKEFATLRSSLRSMADELEEGRKREVEQARLRSWNDMARRVAHELKNPLTPMRIAAATVARIDDPAAVTAGEVLVEEISRLDEMARTFSQFGRLPEGPPSEVDVGEMLTSLAEQHRTDETSVVVDGTAEIPRIEGHYDALLRAFRNLLLNAVEASGPGGRVWLATVPHDDGILVTIGDTGPGIQAELVDRIWEPDFTTKSRGTGLGLPLVLQTVVMHGGNVETVERDGGGAEFRIYLPRKMPGPVPEETEPDEGPPKDNP